MLEILTWNKSVLIHSISVEFAGVCSQCGGSAWSPVSLLYLLSKEVFKKIHQQSLCTQKWNH
jgi:hypothetical protein